MRRSTTQRPGPRRGAGLKPGSRVHVAVEPDRLSALPDALLHHIMSSLKAWEAVRTCMLARRWRHLWASAPFVDLRVRHSSGRDADPPEEFHHFVHRLFLIRDASAPVGTLRLRSGDEDAGYDEDDASAWMRAAINRNTRVIHLAGHRSEIASLDRVQFVSCHLKVLKLSYARLDNRILKQLSSGCTSLEELDLKDCLVTGHGIVSASLKTLIMLECKINWDFSIAAPNLLLLRLTTPYVRVPSFKNLGSLVTGTIILDDSFLGDDFEHISDEDDCDGTTDDDGDDSDDNDWTETSKIHDDSSLGDDFGYDHFIRFGYGHSFAKESSHGRYKDNFDHGSDIDSDDNTYEYSEIANDAKYGCKGKAQISSKDGNYGGNRECNGRKILGGRHILESLSSARTLELLTDAEEVVLSRELRRCPTFSNLKTLSLGEWCMAADFDALIFLLQHSPSIKRLFLQLKLNFSTRKALETCIKLQRSSFTCKELRMVKIKCSKDDGRVHTLAHVFRANSIPLENIYVRRSGNAYLRGQKFMRDLAKQELDECGDDWM
ncbi:F-box protein At3g59000 [Triticum aestivum]|uniref:F-box protein At3g59000 n=1 Tax=Triticum aestivum TaxID=4565 RepID=UPI001D00B2A6|nr:F-box protein At3g59000-like [Triticum aestivum]